MIEVKGPQPKPPTWFNRVEQFVDGVVYALAPGYGAERMALRRLWETKQAQAERIGAPRQSAHDGSESTQYRDGSWLGSRLSPQAVIEQDLETNRSRSRELYRTDSIGGAVDGRANMVVSYGFTPQARIKERAGLATKAQAEQWNQELEDVYEQTAPRICKSGKRSLWQLLRLCEKHHGFDGESFTIMSDRGAADKPIPLTLEVIGPERCETPPKHIGNPRVRLGVEHDANGLIVAYWFRNSHPGDTVDVNQEYTRYDADRVLHVFEPMLAGQTRGMPWLVRALNRAKDAKDLDEAAIIAAQVEACYAAFVASPQGAIRAAEGAADGSVGARRTEEIRPGMIRYLDPEETVTFGAPARPGGNFAPFQEWNYRRVAAGMNYPYEMLSKNWTGLSFAGGRLALTEARLFVMTQQQLLNEAWLCKIWQRMVYEAVIVGAVSIPSRVYEKAPWWFQKHSWNPPAWPFALTPREEIDAKISAVDNNLIPKAKVVAEFGGGDWEDVSEQRRDERKRERDFGIEPATAQTPPQQLPQGDPQDTEKLKEALAA